MVTKHKFFIEQKIRICLTEYSELRNEVMLSRKNQIYLLTSAISTVCVAIGLALALIDDKPPSNNIFFAMEFLFYIIIPGILVFFAQLWLDQVFRQLSIVSYTKQLEGYFRTVVHSKRNTNDCYIPGGYELYLGNIC